MSEAQSSSLDQFVEEASQRSKNCHNSCDKSIVPLATKSFSISEALSITQSSSSSLSSSLSNQSTDISDYDSSDVISSALSALSVSTASLNIKSTVNSITQQHFNKTIITTIDGKKYKSQQKARSSATIILNRNIAITMDRIEFAQISPYFRAAFYGGFSEAKSKLLSFDRSKSEGFLRCCALLNQLMSENKWKMPNLQWMSLQKAFEV
ncbi:hypothetical protein QQG55_30350 [Brugia pahangi]